MVASWHRRVSWRFPRTRGDQDRRLHANVPDESPYGRRNLHPVELLKTVAEVDTYYTQQEQQEARRIHRAELTPAEREAEDAAPQSLPQSSAVTGSRPTLALVYMLTGGPRCAGPGLRAHRSGPRCAGHGRRAHRLPQIRPDVLDAPDFVGSARNRRARTGREAVEMVGQCPWAPCQLARPRPRWTT